MRDRLPELLVPARLSHGRIAPALLALALVIVLASFLAADRALRAASEERARLQKHAVATAVSREIEQGFGALGAFYDSLRQTGNGIGASAGAARAIRAPESSRGSRFPAVRVLDADGRLVFSPAPVQSGSGITWEERAVPRMPGGLSRAVWIVGSGQTSDPSTLILSLRVPSDSSGWAVVQGVLDARSLQSAVDSALAGSGVSFRLRVERSTLTVGAPFRSASAETAVWSAPDAPEVSIATAANNGVDQARLALWCVGIGAIMAIYLGVMMDRQRVQRMADRSAELEHLSAELLRANRAKSEFLANVSHELRTPLNAIVGFVDLLRDGVYGELAPRQVGPVSRIEASATHLRHMVDQILDLAKMAAGRLEVHAELVDLRPFVLEVAGEIEPLLAEKGLSFSIAVGATLPKVRIDPAHLRQILVNLLGNAVKFTSVGGVSVRARIAARRELAGEGRAEQVRRHDGPWVALQVIDTGVGIPRREWERIFDEFEQLNAGPRGDSMRRGTGLGLSISRRLARLMDGDITVESEEGKGSVFTVWLPAEPRAANRPAISMGAG